MAEQSGFFSSVGGDRQYTMDFLAKWIASIIGNGIYNGELALVASGNGLQLTLPAGRAWINGYHYFNDADMTFTADSADGVLNRKDTFVLRWDVNARSITAQLLKGTPASIPTAPAIVRTAEQYDLKLAEISIPAGTTTVTQSLITDCRADESVCGIVTGVVQQLETSTLLQQLSDAFSIWFQGMKDQLTTDAAGNLQTEITNILNGSATVYATEAQGTKADAALPATGYTAADVLAKVKSVNDMAYQQLDIIDGNFQVSSIGAGKNSIKTANGYPIWDTWKWYDYASDGKCGVKWLDTAYAAGTQYGSLAQIIWTQAMNVTRYAYELLTFIEKGVSELCGHLNGKKITVSFNMSVQNPGEKVSVMLRQTYGTGGSPSAADSQYIDVAGPATAYAWQRMSVTFTPIEVSGKTFGTNGDDYLTVAFSVDGTNNPSTSGNVSITQVQIDVGDVALPYRNKSFGEELRACQRYFERSYGYGVAVATSAVGGYAFGTQMTSTFALFGVRFAVPKRVAPSVQIYGKTSANCVLDVPANVAVTGSSVNEISQSGFGWITTAANTVGDPLVVHWVADARY